MRKTKFKRSNEIKQNRPAFYPSSLATLFPSLEAITGTSSLYNLPEISYANTKDFFFNLYTRGKLIYFCPCFFSLNYFILQIDSYQ